MCYIYRPAGFNPPDNSTITIHFNALLPKAAWEWDDSTSEVYMRFMHKDLGEWKYDFGPGEVGK